MLTGWEAKESFKDVGLRVYFREVGSARGLEAPITQLFFAICIDMRNQRSEIRCKLACPIPSRPN